MLPGVTLCASALLAAAQADRSAARAVLRTAGCDSCHDSAVSAANAKAPAADRQTVQKFIDAELRARRARTD
jgi:hypothetical protein